LNFLYQAKEQKKKWQNKDSDSNDQMKRHHSHFEYCRGNLTFRTKLKNTNDDNTELDSISCSLEKQTDDGGLIIVQM
jgi:hypothetical protein